MKIKISCLVLLSVVNTAFCDSAAIETEVPVAIHDHYPYVTLGVGPVILIPNIGIGYRERYGRFGWDSSLSVSTIGIAHQLSSQLVGHCYFNPLRQNSGYLGLGILGSGIFSNYGECDGTISPDFVFGKELERVGDSRHFIEMHVGIPTSVMGSAGSETFWFPLMYVKYGISF